MPSMTLRQAFAMATQFQEAGRLEDAESLYRQIIARDPQCADAMQMLGVVVRQLGRRDEGIDWMRQANQGGSSMSSSRCFTHRL